MKKVNGVLAEAFRSEIYLQDLTIKEVAGMIHRSETVVYTILRGDKVGDRTIKQVEKAFPSVFA